MNEMVKIVPLVVFIYKWIINTTSELVKNIYKGQGQMKLLLEETSSVSSIKGMSRETTFSFRTT